MSGSVTFEGRIEALSWGNKVFTVVRLPLVIMAELGQPKRVEGEINDHPVNLAPARAPDAVIADAFLWAGKEFLKAAGIAPGDVFEVSLRAVDPDAVEVPGDVQAALMAADVRAAWDALTPGRKRGFLHQISTAKRAVTRAARIEKLVQEMLA